MESKPNPYASFDPKPLIGQIFDSYDVTLSQKDLILYALAIGFNQKDQLNKDHFRFTYENDENFGSFPTIANALSIANFDKFADYKGFPKFDMNKLLHGEEEITILKPVKGDGTKYRYEFKFLDFQDKGKMTVMIAEKLLKEVDSGDVCARIVNQCVIRDMGGFGFKGTMKSVLQENKPDK